MASLVIIEDINGDTVDYNIYCCDSCAKTDKLYKGFYGCQELEFNEICLNCKEVINGIKGDYSDL